MGSDMLFASSFRTIRKSLFFSLFLLSGCVGGERAEREKLRRLNCKAEPLYRNRDEKFYSLPTPIHLQRASYPWESESNLPKITKDFFRCRGSAINPPLVDKDSQPLHDCEGSSRHGLPVISGKEGVYPILIHLLNYVQKKTGKRVVITCGHRCPLHNTYADPALENRTSKHQIGAEVDFYVQGMEERPQEIVGLIMQYFQETSPYAGDKESREFKRLETDAIATNPWLNKEIVLKLFQKTEGRDWDNRHPHPYLSVQVRYDRDHKEKVAYTWAKANQGYPRS